jgi:hypothetical protein
MEVAAAVLPLDVAGARVAVAGLADGAFVHNELAFGDVEPVRLIWMKPPEVGRDHPWSVRVADEAYTFDLLENAADLPARPVRHV